MRTTVMGLAAAMLLALPAAAEPVIVTAAAARVRNQPSTTGAEVSRLALGAVVDAGETAGAGADTWRQVTANGVNGWIAARFTAPFAPGGREQAYLALARQKMAVESPAFGDAVELVQFLDRATNAVQGREARAELALDDLLALQMSLAAIPVENRDAAIYQAWTESQKARVVYSEPSGEWYVRAETLWDLEKAYRDTRLGERIAWEAAQIPLPGECEGYLPCGLSYLLQTEGEYLLRYPGGAHAAEAMKSVQENIDGAIESFDQFDSSLGGDMLGDFMDVAKGIRRAIAKAPGADKALRSLAALEVKVRALPKPQG